MPTRPSHFIPASILLLAGLVAAGTAEANPIVIDFTRTTDPLVTSPLTTSVTGFAVEPGSPLTIDISGQTTSDGGGFLNTGAGGLGVITDLVGQAQLPNGSDVVIGNEDTLTIVFNFDGELIAFDTSGSSSNANVTLPDGSTDNDGVLETPTLFTAGQSVIFGAKSGTSYSLTSLTVIPTPATGVLLLLGAATLTRRRGA